MPKEQTKKRILSQEKICLKALEIINEEGLEKLSMRRLAQRLNVESASLYNHIQNKAALLDLIQEKVFNTLVSPNLKIKNDWKKYLKELAKAMRQGLLQYPNIAPLFATRPSLGIAALEQAEKALGVLHEAGFKYSEVLHAYQSLCVFVIGHLQAEAGYVPGAKEEIEPTVTSITMDPRVFPHLTKAIEQTGVKKYNEWFDFGVDMIINGLDAILKKRLKK